MVSFSYKLNQELLMADMGRDFFFEKGVMERRGRVCPIRCCSFAYGVVVCKLFF